MPGGRRELIRAWLTPWRWSATWGRVAASVLMCFRRGIVSPRSLPGRRAPNRQITIASAAISWVAPFFRCASLRQRVGSTVGARRRLRGAVMAAAALLLFLVAPEASGVPGNEADPPMPPSDFGNLFDDGRPRVRDCRIDGTRSNASQSTIMFRSNYPHNRARYINSASVWSSWTSLSAHEYVCTAPGCLWFGGQVEIRGCTDAAGTNCPSACIVTVGQGAGGRPIVDPAGLPKPIANHAGCAQSNHTELTFIARWTGAAASGYPRVRDTGGNPIPLTWVSGSTSAGVYTGTYTIPAGWSAGFEGTWSFEFLIDAGRTHHVNVQVGEHCLTSPRVYQVDTGGTRTEVFDGATIFVGSASRMVLETGNVGLTLTNHVLDPSAQTLGTIFNATQPAPGTTITESWSEAADGWDGRAYTSPDVDIDLSASTVVCVSDGTHSFWLSPASPTVTLPTATTATTVATVQTDACSGVVGTAPVITPANRHSILGTIAVTWNVLAGNESTGWPVQATPALANGLISDAATFSGTGWPPAGETITVNRAGATTCPPGERVVAGVCQTCPTYQACVAGTTQTVDWCSAGPPPADTSCPTCTINEQLVERSGVWVCEPIACPPGERPVAGVCQTCPDYDVCVGGSLTTQQWCNSGSPPPNANNVSHLDCVNGVTQSVTVCVDAGDTPPSDFSCPPAPTCLATEVLEWDDSIGANGGWVCNPLTCPAGERAVAGVCQPCPNYDVCVGGSLTSQQWCNAGNPPTNAAMGSYNACVGGSLTSLSVCLNPGDSAPASATSVNYLDCVNGVTQTLTACVDAGDPAPSDFSCPPAPTCAGTETLAWDDSIGANGGWVCNPISCPSGQRAVAGVCQPCPNYQVCSGGSLSTQQWCSAGNPPTNAAMGSYNACVGGSLTSLSVCLNPGDSAPASAFTAQVRYCDSGGSLRTRTDCINAGGTAPGNAYTTQVQYCDSGTTRNRTVCVDAGSSAPSDAPCTTCPPGQELVGLNCVACSSTETYCSGSSSRTRPIASCTDQDNRSATEWSCNGGSAVSATLYGTCTDVDNRPSSCPSGQEMNSDGCCVPCSATEWYCSGSSSRSRTISGCTDRDTRSATRRSCSGSSTVTSTIYGTCTDDDDRSATSYYCSGSSSASTTIYGTCSDSDSRSGTERYCSGSSVRTRSVSGVCGTVDTTGATESYCSGSQVRTRSIAGCVDNDLTGATETYCSGSSVRTRTISGCSDVDSTGATEWYCSGSSTASRSIAGCVNNDTRSGTERYCSGSSVRTRSVSGVCGTVDNTGATRFSCSGSSTVTTAIAGCVDEDTRSGTERYCSGSSVRTRSVAGTCGTIDTTGATEWYCSGSSTASRSIAGCVDSDNRSGTELYCSGSSQRSRSISGVCGTVDNTGATSTYCSGTSVVSVAIAGCVDSDTTGTTETYCSGGSVRTRSISGCSPVDSTGATESYCSGTSVRTRSIAGCVDNDLTGATETYCSGSSVRTRTISGCVDLDTTGATESYCSGTVTTTRPIAGCQDVNSIPDEGCNPTPDEPPDVIPEVCDPPPQPTSGCDAVIQENGVIIDWEFWNFDAESCSWFCDSFGTSQ